MWVCSCCWKLLKIYCASSSVRLTQTSLLEVALVVRSYCGIFQNTASDSCSHVQPTRAKMPSAHWYNYRLDTFHYKLLQLRFLSVILQMKE